MTGKEEGRDAMEGSRMVDRFIELIGAARDLILPASRSLDHLREGMQTRQDKAGQEGAEKGERPDPRLEDIAIGRPDRRRTHTRSAAWRS